MAGWRDEMRGQRQRLAALFLHFLQQPAVNPVAAAYNSHLTLEQKTGLQSLLGKPVPPP